MAKAENLLMELDELLHKQQRLMHIAFANQQKAEGQNVTVPQEEVDSRVIPSGSRVYLWKQDPSVTRVGIRKVFLPHVVEKGPKDAEIEAVLSITTKSGNMEKDVKASALAVPDEQNDFLADIDGDPFAFDLVHTYTVARLTLDMYQRDLGVKDWRWQWDLVAEAGTLRTPLRIIAHAGDKCNSVYHRGKKAIKFYFYTPKQGKTTYLCRSYDIVAHETGHAILDAIKPALYPIKKGQSGALHESFADLTAIFSVLSQMDLCEDVIAETKGNIRKARYVTCIGEQFAGAMRAAEDKVAGREEDEANEEEMEETAGVRDANNTLKGADVGPNDLYALANVFTGFVWDVLVKVYEWERDPQMGSSDADTLYRVAKFVRWIFINSFLLVGDTPDFVEISYAMERAAEHLQDRKGAARELMDTKKYKEVIAACRTSRELSMAGKPRHKQIDLGDC